MAENTPIYSSSDNSKGSRRDMLIIVGIVFFLCCGIGGLGVSGYFIYQNYQLSANEQATASVATQVKALEFAQSTQSAEATAAVFAQATAQAAAQATSQAQFTLMVNSYELFDQFNSNVLEWEIGPQENDYWIGNIEIKGGQYQWDVTETKDTFIGWRDPDVTPLVQNFDATVDVKRVSGAGTEVCYGLVYHNSLDTLNDGAIALTVCDSQEYSIDYYDVEVGWDTLVDWTDSSLILSDDWNRLSISAENGTYTFSVNDQLLDTVNEDRITEGYVSLFMTVYELVPGTVWFDNFGLNPR